MLRIPTDNLLQAAYWTRYGVNRGGLSDVPAAATCATGLLNADR